MNNAAAYPKHCKTCWKLTKCKQKQNMVAGTEPVEGWTDFDESDYFCGNCLDKNHEHAGLQASEADQPVHCSKCGIPLDCPLTTDGVEYVKEAIADGGGCCRELWPVLFADYLTD